MVWSAEIFMVNTICIRGSIGNFQIKSAFFVEFIGADYNRWIWNYKIKRFTVFVRGSWAVGDIKFWTFTGGGVTKTEHVQTGGGSKFWWFSDNVIIECHFWKTTLITKNKESYLMVSADPGKLFFLAYHKVLF